MRTFYSLFKVSGARFAPLDEHAVIPLKEIVRSSRGRRLRGSRGDFRKTLYSDETISDPRSRDFRDVPHAACTTTPVFVALLIPAPTSNLLLLTWRGDVLADRFAIGRFFAALTAVNAVNTCEGRSTNRSRVPLVLLNFVLSGFVLSSLAQYFLTLFRS